MVFTANYFIDTDKQNSTGKKNNLVQLKKQTTQNTAKQNYPGSVASYDIRPGNEVGLFYTTLPIPRDTGQYKEEIKEPQTAIQHEILSCPRPHCVTLYKACSIPSPHLIVDNSLAISRQTPLLNSVDYVYWH